MGPRRIRTVVADDHPIVLHVLAAFLEACGDLDLVGRYADGLTAFEGILALRPDVAIVDIEMPGMNGLELLRSVRREQLNTRVVLLTALITDHQVYEATRMGAQAVVLKDATPETLLASVRDAANGGAPVWSAMLEEALERERQRRRQRQERIALLTAQELKVAELVAKGLATKQIAHALDITEGTTRLHLHKLYQKLEVQDRLTLQRLITREGLLGGD